jgi:hypothetical protein
MDRLRHWWFGHFWVRVPDHIRRQCSYCGKWSPIR